MAVRPSRRPIRSKPVISREPPEPGSDALLGTASAAGTALFDQRGRLGGAAGRLAAVGDRFPVVGGLLTAIGRRKERDTIIVSAVAGGCAFFTFLYWLRK